MNRHDGKVTVYETGAVLTRENSLVQVLLKQVMALHIQAFHNVHVRSVGIPATRFVAVYEMMDAAEYFYETLRFHIVVDDFLYVEFFRRGQQTEQFVQYVLIALHMLMRAIHLPKKRDGLGGLSCSFYFLLNVL